MDRLAIFLIKRRLGIKEGQKFYFRNQKDKQDRYAFEGKRLVKYPNFGRKRNSSISLNWIVSNRARKTIIVDDDSKIVDKRLNVIESMNKFKNGEFDIHINNVKEEKQFLELCEKRRGIKWLSGENPTMFRPLLTCESFKGGYYVRYSKLEREEGLGYFLTSIIADKVVECSDILNGKRVM